MTLRTSGGGIHVKEQGAGAVEAKTSGGGIHVEGRPATVDLNTSGGGIHFKGQTEAFQARTSGGSISLDGVRLVSGEHRAKTAGGSIKVRLTAELSVDVSAQTSAGHLSMDLPGIKGEQSGPRMSPRYRGTYNSGAARLDLSTAAGSISVGLSDEPGAGAPSLPFPFRVSRAVAGATWCRRSAWSLRGAGDASGEARRHLGVTWRRPSLSGERDATLAPG